MKLYDHEAESMILAAFMLDAAAVERLMSFLKLDDFDRHLFRQIFEDIVRLHKSGTTADFRAVSNELKKREDTAGIIELSEISTMTSSSANVDYYVGIVKDLSVRRATHRIIDDARMALERQDVRGIDIACDVEREISATTLGNCGTEYRHVSKCLVDVCEELDWSISTMGKIRGVEAPYKGMENITGFRNGEYIIIAARPSMGKTAMALNIIETVAIRRKIPAGFFSLEMSATQLNLRLVSSITGYNNQGIIMGLYRSTDAKEKMHRALVEISESPLYIDDTGGLKLSELKTKARRMVHVDKCQIIFLDYIGLVNAEQPKLPRHEQIAEVSRSIKNLAKELKVPFVVLSQLTRDVEGKKPGLNSLAETRSLEQDADVIGFIHRDRVEDMDESRRHEMEDAIPTELIFAKNRNGPTGICPMIYKPRITKFVDVDK